MDSTQASSAPPELAEPGPQLKAGDRVIITRRGPWHGCKVRVTRVDHSRHSDMDFYGVDGNSTTYYADELELL